MINSLHYDFSSMKRILSDLPENQINEILLKNELNIFFKDLECISVKYTNNIDKEFFGITITLPSVSLNGHYNNNNNIIDCWRPTKYMIEYDSKLFDKLTIYEIIAITIDEINTVVSANTIEKFIGIFDYYKLKSNSSVSLEDFIGRDDDEKDFKLKMDLFYLVLNETIRIISSNIDNPDCPRAYQGNLLNAYNKMSDYISGCEKLAKIKQTMFSDDMPNNYIALQWLFNIIPELSSHKLSIVYTLKKTIELIGSRDIKLQILKVIKDIEDLSESMNRKYTSLTEASKIKKKSLSAKMKFNGLRSLEEDVFEYQMRIKNIETEADAILLMRQISSNIQLLEDYIIKNSIDDRELDRWQKLLNKYIVLRDELSRKSVYKQKMYGLFVDYGSLAKMYDNGGFNII